MLISSPVDDDRPRHRAGQSHKEEAGEMLVQYKGAKGRSHRQNRRAATPSTFQRELWVKS